MELSDAQEKNPQWPGIDPGTLRLGAWHVHQLNVQQPYTYEKPEAASAVLGFWWWAVCRPKHGELHINMEK
jgi:hypothetical protein